jgi:molecular chaperone HscB
MGSNTAVSAKPIKCSACQQPMASPLFCAHCHTLFPADGLNHFELLGLLPCYDLDPDLLRQRYLALTRDIHPDRLAADANEPESTFGLRINAQVNRAYQVLSDLVLRAETLLELAGGHPASADKSVPPEVLHQTLALREEIEAAQAGQDGAALAAARGQVEVARAALLDEIAALARQLPGDAALRQSLRERLNAIRYFQKMQELF